MLDRVRAQVGAAERGWLVDREGVAARADGDLGRPGQLPGDLEGRGRVRRVRVDRAALKSPPSSGTNFTVRPSIGPNTLAAACEPLMNCWPIVLVEPVMSAMIPTVIGPFDDGAWAAAPLLAQPATRVATATIAAARIVLGPVVVCIMISPKPQAGQISS